MPDYPLRLIVIDLSQLRFICNSQKIDKLVKCQDLSVTFYRYGVAQAVMDSTMAQKHQQEEEEVSVGRGHHRKQEIKSAPHRSKAGESVSPPIILYFAASCDDCLKVTR